jgi:DUF4097 and DUF4098 domain-containing protein YvlB
MKSKIESYIKENQEAFNTHEPTSNLWGSVQSNIPASTVVRQVKWLKSLGIGLGVTTLGLTSYFLMTEKNASTLETVVIEQTIPVEDKLETTLLIEEPSDVTQNEKEESPLLAPSKLTYYPINMASLDLKSIEKKSYLATYKTPVLSDSRFSPSSYSLGNVKDSKSSSTVTRNVWKDTLFEGVKKVVLNSSFMDLKVTQHDKSYVSFNSEVPSERQEKELKEADFKLNFERLGDVLTITTCIKPKKRCKIHCDDENNALITLHVPAQTELELRSSSGNIEVTKLESKYLKVNSSLGDLILKNVTSEFDLHNALGDIELTSLKGDAKVTSSSGDVDIITVEGSYEVRATLGNLFIENLKGSLQANSTSGDIILKEIESKYMVNVHSSLGNVDAEKLVCPIKVTTTAGNVYLDNLEGDFILKSSLGNHKLNHVKGSGSINSTTGDIRLYAIHGDVKIRSTLGDVKYEASSGAGLIESNSGDVRLKDITLSDNLTVICTLGDIDIEVENAGSEISYALKTTQGDIDVSLGDERIEGKKELAAGNGNIQISLTTSSGSINLKSN